MEAMIGLLIVAGLFGVVWLLGQLRTAAEDVIDGALRSGAAKVRGPQPTTWWIVPGELGAHRLADGLQAGASGPASPFEGTVFTATPDHGDLLVRCVTPPGRDLQAVQIAALGAGRDLDEQCRIRL